MRRRRRHGHGRRIGRQRHLRRSGPHRRSRLESVQDCAAHGRHPQRRLRAEGRARSHRAQDGRPGNRLRRLPPPAPHARGRACLRPLSRLRQHRRSELHARLPGQGRKVRRPLSVLCAACLHDEQRHADADDDVQCQARKSRSGLQGPSLPHRQSALFRRAAGRPLRLEQPDGRRARMGLQF